MDKDIIISVKTVFYTFLLLAVGFLFYKLFPIIALVLVSALIVIVLEPAVQAVQATKIFGIKPNRSFAVGFVYILVLSIIIVVLTIGLPPVVIQAQHLLETLGVNFSDSYLNILDSFTNDLTQISNVVNTGSISSILSGVSKVFSNLVAVISLLALSIYMSLDWLNLKSRIFANLPDKYKTEIKNIVAEIELSLGNWAKGQLLLMLIVGSISAIGLFVLDVEYALALGLMAGLLEIVPLIGPIISGILGFVVGYSISPFHGLATIVLFIVIQQLENNLIVPKVMQKVSGFSPLVILIAVLAGGNVFGVVGAITAIPIFMVMFIIFKHIWNRSFK